jgi:hypothetical protein
MRKWTYELMAGKQLRQAISDDDMIATLDALKECWKEINKAIPDVYDIDDLENDLEELDNQLDNCENYEDYGMTEDDVQDEINYLLRRFYDICDDLRIWVEV